MLKRIPFWKRGLTSPSTVRLSRGLVWFRHMNLSNSPGINFANPPLSGDGMYRRR